MKNPNSINLMARGNWIPFFKPLAKVAGDTDPAIFLSELANRFQWHEEKQTLTPDGWFYATIPDISEEIPFSPHRQRKAIDWLVKRQLILKPENRGLPPKRYFKFHPDFDLNFVNILEEFKRLKNLTFKGKPLEDSQRLKNSTFKDENFEPTNVKKATAIDTTISDTTADTTFNNNDKPKNEFEENEFSEDTNNVPSAGGAAVASPLPDRTEHANYLVTRFNQYRDELLNDGARIEKIARVCLRSFPSILIDKEFMEKALVVFFEYKDGADELSWSDQKQFNKNVLNWLQKKYLKNGVNIQDNQHPSQSLQTDATHKVNVRSSNKIREWIYGDARTCLNQLREFNEWAVDRLPKANNSGH